MCVEKEWGRGDTERKVRERIITKVMNELNSETETEIDRETEGQRLCVFLSSPCPLNGCGQINGTDFTTPILIQEQIFL